jgi:hypothetical protein
MIKGVLSTNLFTDDNSLFLMLTKIASQAGLIEVVIKIKK